MQANFQRFQEASNRHFQAMTAHYKEVNDNLIARSRAADAVRADGTTGAMQNDINTQASIDNAAQRTVQYSLHRQTFVNPASGQKIEASTQFNHNWISSDGTSAVLNDGPNFDPNGVVNPQPPKLGRTHPIQLNGIQAHTPKPDRQSPPVRRLVPRLSIPTKALPRISSTSRHC
jgi:hypothetical protein